MHSETLSDIGNRLDGAALDALIARLADEHWEVRDTRDDQSRTGRRRPYARDSLRRHYA
jgi:hypothetical protein